MNSLLSSGLAAMLAGSFLCPLALHAEDLPNTRNLPGLVPHTPPSAPPAAAPEVEETPLRPPLRTVGRPAGQTLRKIIFTGDPRHFSASPGAIATNGVALLEARPALQGRLLREYVGQPLSRDTAGRIARATLDYYVACEHPVVFIQPVEVDFRAGVVVIGVLESKVESVTASGARWSDDERLARHLRVQQGETIDREALLNDLAWVNESSFLKSNIMLEPGRQPGTTRVRLEVEDRFPVRVFAGVENTGSRQNGEWRWLAGANWATDRFGFYQQFSYQYSTAFEAIERQPVHAMSWTASLPWHHRFAVYGSYATTDLDLSQSLGVDSLSYHGEQWQISPRYSIPIGRLYGPVQQTVSFGFDWKRSDLAYLQDGLSVPTDETDVIQAAISYEAKVQDSSGETRFSLNGYWSPGGLGQRNSQAAYRQVDPRLTSEYVYGILRFGRTQQLLRGFTASLDVEGHLASDSLPSSEQVAIGGYGTVRGYPERVLFGDSGLILNLELRTPAFSIGESLGWTRWKDQTQLLVFFDFGLVSSHDPLPGDDKTDTLASAGVGVRQRIGENFSVRADYGFPLIDPDLGIKTDPRVSLGVLLSY